MGKKSRRSKFGVCDAVYGADGTKQDDEAPDDEATFVAARSALRAFDAARVLKILSDDLVRAGNAVALVKLAWSLDKSRGKEGAVFADGGLLSAVWIGISQFTRKQFRHMTCDFNADNASAAILFAAMDGDDARLLLVLLTWDPEFRIFPAPGTSSAQKKKYAAQEAADKHVHLKELLQENKAYRCLALIQSKAESL